MYGTNVCTNGICTLLCLYIMLNVLKWEALAKILEKQYCFSYS